MLRNGLGWLDDHASRVVTGLLGAVVVGSVLAVGTVHVSVLLVVAPVAVLSGTLALRAQRVRVRDLPAPGLVLVLLAIWSGIQSAPMPIAWLWTLAPNSARVWAYALEPFGSTPSAWASLSLDPGASLTEALKWLSYSAVFMAAAFVGATRGRRAGVSIVFASAVTAALVTIAHGLAGAVKLYGFYEPSLPKPVWNMSPLIGANSFAGYLNLGAFAGFGLLVARHRSPPRWLFGLGVAVILGVSMTAASRGGWGALGLGMPLLAVVLWRVGGRQPERSGRGWRLWVELGVVAGCGVTLFGLGVTEDVWRNLLDDSLRKLALIDWTRSLIGSHFWFGVGRGAFETAFPAYRGDGGHQIYQYAENFAAQWCAEWGVPVSVVALLSLVFMFRPRRLAADRDLVAASSLVGVVVLLVQNMMDLALEIASVSIACVTILGCLWGAGRAAEQRSKRRKGAPIEGVTRLGGAAWVLASLGFAATLAVVLVGRNPALEDRDRLSKLVMGLRQGNSLNERAVREELRAAIARHPADPYLPLLGALAARRARQNPLPWIGRAIERDGKDGRPYLLLGSVLGDRGAQGQALSTLRMAVELEPGLCDSVAQAAIRITRDPVELARGAPAGAAGGRLLISMAAHLSPKEHGAARQALIKAAIERAPTYVDARFFAIEDLLLEFSQGDKSARCSAELQEACQRELDEHAAVVARVDPRSDRPPILRARAWLARGQPGKADAVLIEACDRPQATLECWQWRLIAAFALPASSARAEVERSYLARACSDATSCGAAASFVATKRAGRGDWLGATELYERAVRENGDPQGWLQVARAAANAGLQGRAARAIERAKSAGVETPADLEQVLRQARAQRILSGQLRP